MKGEEQFLAVACVIIVLGTAWFYLLADRLNEVRAVCA